MKHVLKTPGYMLLIVLLVSGWMGCQGHSQDKNPKQKEGAPMRFRLSSPVFQSGGEIPSRYTCDGPDVSPPLEWTNTPDGTRSLVLICDDPDAPVGTWVHWVIYNVPADRHELPEDVPKQEVVFGKVRQGINDFRRIGYGGPCPPAGKPHRYFFKLYALDIPSDWESGLTKAQVLEKMQGHVLAEAELMGMYQR